MLEKDVVCNYCGIVQNHCNIKNDISELLDIFLIPDLSNIVIKYLECDNLECNNILHKNLSCCSYMCDCEDYDCSHFIVDLDRVVSV